MELQSTSSKRKGESQEAVSKSKPSKVFSITYTDLSAICFATRHVPDRTPRRWDLISNLVSDYSRSLNKENTLPTVMFHHKIKNILIIF